MVSLIVNSEEIPSNHLADYQQFFERAENFIKARYAEKRNAIAVEMEKQANANANVYQKLSEDDKKALSVYEQGKNPNKKYEPVRNQDISAARNGEKKKSFAPDENWAINASRIKGVLVELVKEGVVENTSAVEWFGINDVKMMVNGKEVSKAIHQKLKSTYAIVEGQGLFYGPSQMFGPGVYFDKNDID
jgi:hypothetical protein